MTNPFAPLSPALRALAAEGKVLPATGQAITDMVSPDLEEAYDRATGGRDETVTQLWETPRRRLYHDVTPCYRSEDHRYRYFVDGSARCYFIGTLLEHQRSSPVQLAQVGAAAVRRDETGRIHRAGVHHKILLLLDKTSLSEELWNGVRAVLAGVDGFELRSSASAKDRFSQAMGITEPRARGAHRANWAMREMEVSLAKDDLRDHESWLMMDGSLGTEYMDWDGPPLIGVAKSFRRDSIFNLGQGPRAAQMNLYSLLADLDVNQRTAVFPRWPGEDREGKIVFWYVRIRPQTGLDYPLMGVVKVEMPNPTREPVDSDLADALSGCLAAERCVTPHGRDSRWHAHLYPISLAERVIQDRFHSEQVMKAAIRWPELGISFKEGYK
jgi:hypothetical protein